VTIYFANLQNLINYSHLRLTELADSRSWHYSSDENKVVITEPKLESRRDLFSSGC